MDKNNFTKMKKYFGRMKKDCIFVASNQEINY